MRKTGTNEEVIQAFVNGEIYPCRNSSESVTQRGGILFSYREPIGIRRNDCFIVNGDVWSKTTSSHQQELQMKLRGRRYFTTSFSALEGIISNTSGLMSMRSSIVAEKIRDQIEIIDWTEDWWLSYSKIEEIFIDRRDGSRYALDQLPLGMEIRYKDYKPFEAHLPGAVLMEYTHRDGVERTHAIAAMDERQYFVSILPRLANDVEDAFTSLKPQEAVEAQKKGLKVLRQGEWFFIEHLEGQEAKEEYYQMEQEFKLIGRNGGNPHIATRGEWLDSGMALASGSVRHEEHRSLRLSVAINPLIFVAVENTALRSFSAQGVVD